MTPIPLILTAVCEAAGITQHELATGRKAPHWLARLAFASMLVETGMSILEATRKAHMARSTYHESKRRAVQPHVQRIIRDAKWLVEQRDRPRGRNILFQWPPASPQSPLPRPVA